MAAIFCASISLLGTSETTLESLTGMPVVRLSHLPVVEFLYQREPHLGMEPLRVGEFVPDLRDEFLVGIVSGTVRGQDSLTPVSFRFHFASFCQTLQ